MADIFSMQGSIRPRSSLSGKISHPEIHQGWVFKAKRRRAAQRLLKQGEREPTGSQRRPRGTSEQTTKTHVRTERRHSFWPFGVRVLLCCSGRFLEDLAAAVFRQSISLNNQAKMNCANPKSPQPARLQAQHVDVQRNLPEAMHPTPEYRSRRSAVLKIPKQTFRAPGKGRLVGISQGLQSCGPAWALCYSEGDLNLRLSAGFGGGFRV